MAYKSLVAKRRITVMRLLRLILAFRNGWIIHRASTASVNAFMIMMG